MAMTVRGVLGDDLFSQTEPVMEAGTAGLDNVVRWAYTNERYDIADFLSGGELLIIEGSSLLGGMSDGEINRYVDALADARVAGVAIELVQGVREVPQAMRIRADHRGLPIIGMHVRRPFVDLCESINTAIVRGRLLYHTHVDVLYTDLRRELSRAKSAEDVAVGLAGLFGEQVDIFTAQGLHVATAGMASNAGVARSMQTVSSADEHAIFAVRRNGNPLAVVEMTQRMRVFDSSISAAVEHALNEELPRMMDTDIAAAMVSRIARGPRNNAYADQQEAQDAAVMLQALGHETGYDVHMVHVPFAVVVRSLTESCDYVASELSESDSEFRAESGSEFDAGADTGGDVESGLGFRSETDPQFDPKFGSEPDSGFGGESNTERAEYGAESSEHGNDRGEGGDEYAESEGESGNGDELAESGNKNELAESGNRRTESDNGLTGSDKEVSGEFDSDSGNTFRHDIIDGAAVRVSYALNGCVFTGVISCRFTEGVDVAAACRRWLTDMAESGQVWTIVGENAPDARSLIDQAGMVNAAMALSKPHYGGMTRAIDLMLTRFTACESMETACSMLLALMLPGGVRDDETLMHTLAACFDAMDNKTGACSVLGIQRQTLYNRLDKVARLTGASRDDAGRWSLTLFAAKLALADDKQGRGAGGHTVQSTGGWV